MSNGTGTTTFFYIENSNGTLASIASIYTSSTGVSDWYRSGTYTYDSKTFIMTLSFTNGNILSFTNYMGYPDWCSTGSYTSSQSTNGYVVTPSINIINYGKNPGNTGAASLITFTYTT